MSRTHRTLLAIIRTDRAFVRVDWRGDEVWEGPCIHCGRRLHLSLRGAPISRATVEHIVPRHHGGTDDLRNLAVACARCNHGKGVRHDRRRPDDPALLTLIARLQARRDARWVEPEVDGSVDGHGPGRRRG